MKTDKLGTKTTKQILRERAVALAKKNSRVSTQVQLSFLVFHLGKQEPYALPYEHIEKVTSLESLTPIPGAPPLFLGITYHNAQIWPVINTEILLSFRAIKHDTPPEQLILLSRGDARYSLAVRHVVGHQQLNSSNIVPSTKIGTSAQYITGIYRPNMTIVNNMAILDFLDSLELNHLT